MSNTQKLALTWVGKDARPQLESRILLEDPSMSYHAPQRVREGDRFDNRRIFDDNLLALKALEQEYTGKVKCVFIDPPYNTGSAFTHYDDGVEHAIWLSLMRDRSEMLRSLLSDNGFLWVTIDDNEAHYLKVICDEIFGRANFVANVIWEKADSPRNSAWQFSTDHDHSLVSAKNADRVPIRLARTDESNSIYTNSDNDPRGAWLPGDPYANKPYSKGRYTITGPTGREFAPPPGRYGRVSEERPRDLDQNGRVWWGPTGAARPSIKRYLSEVGDLVPRTFWSNNDLGSNRTSKNEMRSLFPGDTSFATRKPERLISRVLSIATTLGDLVLDSFAGSGTTGAVAHKMGRRWIMIELGEHGHTHIIPRLKKVIDREDPGGVTAATRWKGGGGFRYYRLAPSRLQQDYWGQWVINKDYNAEMLTGAICKLEGFTYAPSDDYYWCYGDGTESDFIYVTTQTPTAEQLRALSDEVGPARSLLICCGACRGDGNRFFYPTVKKIPKMVLQKCEWGHDDCRVNIANLPQAPRPANPAMMHTEWFGSREGDA